MVQFFSPVSLTLNSFLAHVRLRDLRCNSTISVPCEEGYFSNLDPDNGTCFKAFEDAVIVDFRTASEHCAKLGASPANPFRDNRTMDAFWRAAEERTLFTAIDLRWVFVCGGGEFLASLCSSSSVHGGGMPIIYHCSVLSELIAQNSLVYVSRHHSRASACTVNTWQLVCR